MILRHDTAYARAGIILQYERDGVMKQKPIDLLDLTLESDIEVGCPALIAMRRNAPLTPVKIPRRLFSPKSFAKSH